MVHNDAIVIEFSTKKVLCSAEKSSVIWAEPHSRSSAEPNVRSVTNVSFQGQRHHQETIGSRDIFLLLGMLYLAITEQSHQYNIFFKWQV